MLTQVEIGGTDVTSRLLSYEYERTYGDMLSEVTLRFVRQVNNLIALQEGQTLTIYRGWVTATDEKIFDGYIEKFEPEGGMITVTGIDKLWDLVRKEVTKDYDSTTDPSAGKISAIFTDLVTTYGLLTADGTSVQDSGTTQIITRFKCNHTDIFERCKALSDALDWQFYYRADTDKVYFEPKGYSTNTNTLTVGTEIIQIPKWQRDITEMVNDVTIAGAYQEIETTILGQIGVTSGFATTGITLAYEPISVKVYGENANPPTVLKVGGLPDSSSSYDYFVDKVKKMIYPKDGSPFAANDWYEVRYSMAVPIPINMYDQTSIDSYGRFKKTVTYKDLRNVADAEIRGQNYLTKYATPFIYSTIRVKNSSTYGLAVGQKIQVVDSNAIPAVDNWLVINKLRIRYPADYDELDVGDRYWRLGIFQSDVMEKLKRIEEDEFSNQDILNNLVTVDNTTAYPADINNKYIKVMTQTVAGTNIFILGNTDYGKLGTAQLGATDMGAETTAYVAQADGFYYAQYDNLYHEKFTDEDFKDPTTTGDWNTSTKKLTLTAGQIGVSTSIDYNNGTITHATLSSVIGSTGTYIYYMSADGGAHWETVTRAVQHTFTNSGTDLRWKITCSAGTPYFSEIIIYGYH